MKIRVSYYDEYDDREVYFDGTIDFNNLTHHSSYEVIEEAVLSFDDICIDYGGDDEFYELDIADYDPKIDLYVLGPQILKTVEDALKDAGVK